MGTQYCVHSVHKRTENGKNVYYFFQHLAHVFMNNENKKKKIIRKFPFSTRGGNNAHARREGKQLRWLVYF